MKNLLLGFAGMFVGVAFANPTIVAWENDFSTLKKDNVTLDLQGNAVDGDGGVAVGAKGLKLTRTDNFAGAASNAAVTVIVEASDITAAGTLGGVAYGSTDVTARRNADGTLSTYWGANKGSTSALALTDAGAHRLAFVCGNAGANLRGLHVYVDGAEWVNRAATASSSSAITGVLVGGNQDGSSVATGMKVSRVAVVDGALTPEEVASYVWPSARNGYYELFKEHFSDRVISFTGKNQIAIYSFVGTLFDLDTRANTDKTYAGGTETTDLPGYTGETKRKTWNIFCRTQPGYVAPGCVVRVPPCTPGNSWRLYDEINDMTLSGLIVEEGAVGTAIADKMIGPGSPVQILTSSKRTISFGDNTGSAPAWFVVNEDFLVDPLGATITLFGEVNFDIAAGRTFHCRADGETPAALALDTNTGATLKMHGSGTLKFATLTATGTVGLDYSDLPADRATPYVDGNLKIDASTKITLPAALADGGWYRLCSGTVTAATVPASVRVGETEVTDFQLVGNLIALPTTTWTGAAGDNNWSTAENWSKGVPVSGSVADLRTETDVVGVESAAALAGVVALGPLWAIDGTAADGTLAVDGSAFTSSKKDGLRIFRCTGEEKPAFAARNLGDRFRMTWNGDFLIATLATVTDEMLAVYRRWADYGRPILTWSSSNGSLSVTLYSFDPILGVHTGTFTSRDGMNWHVFCQGTPGGWEQGAIFRLAPSFGTAGRTSWSMSPSAMGGVLVEPGAGVYDISCADTENRYSYLGDYQNKVGETWSYIGEDFTNSHGTAGISIWGAFNVEIAEGKVFALKSASPSVAENATLKMHGPGTLRVENRATAPSGGGVFQASGAGLDYSDLPVGRATPYIDGNLKIDASTKITLPAALASGGRYRLCSGTVTAAAIPASVRVGETEVTGFALVGNEIVIATTAWTGAAGDSNWSTAENWSNGLPGEGSIASLRSAGLVNVESTNVFANVVVLGDVWTIDGTVSTTTIDFSGFSASMGNGAGLFRCAAAEKPVFTAANLDGKFRMTWNADVLIATLATVTDETLAYYRPWADYGPHIYTWLDPTELGSAARPFDALLGCEAPANFAGKAWGVFCTSQADYEPGAIFRLASKSGGYKSGVWSMSPFTVGGFIVEPGATGVDIQSSAGDRLTHLGDYENKVGETWSRIDENFALSHGRKELDIYGLFNLEIADGKVFTVRSANPHLAANATLKMHGAGTLRVEQWDTKSATPSGEAGVLSAVSSAGLDFSDLPLDRATPFIDGNLRIDKTTRFTFPAALGEGVAYALCSGTLTKPSENWMAKIRLGDVEKLVFLTFEGNAVSYRLGENVGARIGDAYYETVQDAFDAAGADAVIDVIKAGNVTLTANKTIRSLNAFGDITVGGAGALTFAADGALDVGEDRTVVFNVPLVIAGTVVKTGEGGLTVNGSVSTAGETAGDLVVKAGTADFDGAITGVTVRGCGTDPNNWPVITLKANCTVSENAVVTPVRYYASDGDSVKRYGKVVQNGAAYTCSSALGLMSPNNGEGKYVLNSGTLAVSGTLSLQSDYDYRYGKMTFEMNGGELCASDFNMCRTGTSDNNGNRYLLVLNGGTFTTANGIVGTSSVDAKDGHLYVGWQEHKRVEFNGGTWNVGNKALLFDTNIVWVVASGDITLANNEGVTTVVPDCLVGMDSLTFAGAGTLDVSGFPAGTCDDYTVTGGQLVLGANNLSETTPLKASGTGRFGLKFEGVRDVKAYFVGGRQKTIGYEYGVNAHGSTRFVATEPSGAVRLLEGCEPTGTLIFVR